MKRLWTWRLVACGVCLARCVWWCVGFGGGRVWWWSGLVDIGTVRAARLVIRVELPARNGRPCHVHCIRFRRVSRHVPAVINMSDNSTAVAKRMRANVRPVCTLSGDPVRTYLAKCSQLYRGNAYRKRAACCSVSWTRMRTAVRSYSGRTATRTHGNRAFGHLRQSDAALGRKNVRNDTRATPRGVSSTTSSRPTYAA